jgi:hypothetical protein
MDKSRRNTLGITGTSSGASPSAGSGGNASGSGSGRVTPVG